MAVVLSSPEDNNYFSSGGLHRSHSSKNTRSHSSNHHSYTPSSHLSTRSVSSSNFRAIISPSPSPYSSAPSSPRISNSDFVAPSYTATPASSLSLDSECDEDDLDQITFPSYDDPSYYLPNEDLETPTDTQGDDDACILSQTTSNPLNASLPDSPDLQEHAEDDTAIKNQPTRHVDYLSHSWREEDIWSSWKHIVSKRGAYSNSARLENASWRQWIKSKNKLKTISPENLNWMKDCDVTWLYGPLQTGADKSLKVLVNGDSPESRISKSNSFLNKKPILKKRSMSEIMLQRSLSASSLVKQAAAAVQAQYSEKRPHPAIRAQSDYIAFPFSSRRLSRENTSVLNSVSSSNLSSPYERKHIHFNDEVEQCIALDMKGDDEDEIDAYAFHDQYDSDSDDGMIMMKTSTRIRLPVTKKKVTSHQRGCAPDCKTIATLPSTTLKDKTEDPEPIESAMKHSSNFWGTPKLSPSPSQETLRPSKPSQNILLRDDDDEDEEFDWQPSTSYRGRKDSMAVTQDRFSSLQRTDSSSSLTAEPVGMRRTPSGMFMPYGDDDEDDIVSEGLFGKVVDTVNTAKDIAHVIWNVGWRK